MWVNVGGGPKINCAWRLHTESYTEEHNVPNARGAQNLSALWSQCRQWLHICASCTTALHKPMGLKPSSKLSFGLNLCFSCTAKVEEEQEEKQLQSRFTWWLTAAVQPRLFTSWLVLSRWWKKKISQLSSPADVGHQPLADYYTVFLTFYFLFTSSDT